MNINDFDKFSNSYKTVTEQLDGFNEAVKLTADILLDLAWKMKKQAKNQAEVTKAVIAWGDSVHTAVNLLSDVS